MRPPMSGTMSSSVEEGVGVVTVAFRGQVVLWPSWVLPIMVCWGLYSYGMLMDRPYLS